MKIPNCSIGIVLQVNCREDLVCPRQKVLADISNYMAPDSGSKGGLWGIVHLGNMWFPCIRWQWWQISLFASQQTSPLLARTVTSSCTSVYRAVQGRHAQSSGSGPQNPKVQRLNQKMIMQISRYSIVRHHPFCPSCWTHSCPHASWSRGIKAELLPAAHTFCAFKRFGLSRLGLSVTAWADKECLSLPPSMLCQKMNLWDASFCLQSAAMWEPGAHRHRHTCTRARTHKQARTQKCLEVRLLWQRAISHGMRQADWVSRHCCHNRSWTILAVLSVGRGAPVSEMLLVFWVWVSHG